MEPMRIPKSCQRKVATSTVTAKAAFAHQVLVPDAAIAGPSNAATPRSSHRDVPAGSNASSKSFHSNMSGQSLLEIISQQSSHSCTVPVVLVEKIKSNNSTVVVGSEQRPVDARNGGHGSQVSEYRSKHPMTLRPRSRIQKPNWLSSAASLWSSSVGTESLESESAHSLYEPGREHVQKHTQKENPRGNKRPSNSKQDDNRPRKYFVNNNSPEAPSAPVTQTVMGPPTYIPPRNITTSVISAKRESTSMLPNVELKALSPQPEIDVTSMPSPHPLAALPTPAPELSKPTTYYSTQGIRRWMDNSPIVEMISVPSTSMATHQTGIQYEEGTAMIQVEDTWQPVDLLETPRPASRASDDASTVIIQYDDARLETETPMICTADSWQTVEEIVNAPRSAFNARCTMCRQCEKIEKLIKLTDLLKRQKIIDWVAEDQDEEEPRPGPSSRPDDNYDLLDGDFVCELLPPSRHLVVKLTVTTINAAKKCTASVIPRPETAVTKRFNLNHHEYILDEAIETLSLSLGDPPSDLVHSSMPSVSGSKNRGPHFERSDFIKTPEKEIDDRTYQKTVLEPPTFFPTLKELEDPIAYLEKLCATVSKYGICKIVPQQVLVPSCKSDDDIRFEVTNQCIERLYNRWGSASREMSAVKACLNAQNIPYPRPPLLDGLEVNLPKLHNVVKRFGGLETIIDKKKWGKIADEMKLSRNPMIERKLDSIYFKYLLPFNTLSDEERAELLLRVEKAWNKKYQKLLDRASNPLHRQKCILEPTKAPAPSSSSSPDEVDDDAIRDIDVCIKPGTNMNLAKFRKIASTAYENLFRNNVVSPKDIEAEYWSQVTLANEHICVNFASVDTREQGLGFVPSANGNYKQVPLNLKGLSEHSSNVLKSMGNVLGVTSSTLHLGMVFATLCWHRDPHSLPWIEYLHHGATKIWYGVAAQDEAEFQTTLKTLNPAACQQKPLWLTSNTIMVPPALIEARTFRVYRLEQQPGEYVMVMPRAYSSYISTGYNVSESAYFATERWLDNLKPVFDEVRESCEPTMFALEQILKCIAEDPNSEISVLKRIKPTLELVFGEEIENRKAVESKGIKCLLQHKPRVNRGRGIWPMYYQSSKSPSRNVQEEDECEICRCTLYLSKGLHVPTRESCLCLDHFLKVLATPTHGKTPVSQLEAHFFYSTEELTNTIKTLRVRLELGI